MKKKEDQKWVVYTAKFGKTEIGIYQLSVTVAGGIAFVHPRGKRQQADVIPALNVFDTKSAAAEYLSHQGKRMWVVVNEDDITYENKIHNRRRRSVPVMFEALVLEYTYQHHYRGRTNGKIIKPLGKAVFTVESAYNAKVFTQKKKAESEYTNRWRHIYKDAHTNLVEYQKVIDDLMKNPPRSKKKKPWAGPQEVITSQTHGD